MPAVCFVFHIHEPYRLRRVSFFDIGASRDLFDYSRTRDELTHASQELYQPLFSLCEQLGTNTAQEFRYSLAMSGTALELLGEFAPGVVHCIQRASTSERAELLGTPYFNSLVSLTTDVGEFCEQARLHTSVVQDVFDVTPRMFRNTGLIHSPAIAANLLALGYRGACVERVDHSGCEDSAPSVRGGEQDGLALLECEKTLSRTLIQCLVQCRPGEEDQYAREFVTECERAAKRTPVIGIDLPLMAFGRGSGRERTALRAFEQMISELLTLPEWRCIPVSESAQEHRLATTLPCSDEDSWSSGGNRAESWLANAMQRRAFEELYSDGNRRAMSQEHWHRLQDAEYLSLMNTAIPRAMDVPFDRQGFESPYDAFITYMNVVRAASAFNHSSRATHDDAR